MIQTVLRRVAGLSRPRLAPIHIACLLAGFGVAAPCWSAGTPAGTVIDNTAEVSFVVGGTNVTQNSNTVTLTVDERIDVVVTLQSPQILVAGGDTNRALLLTVTNTGNGNETFLLSIDSSVAGDDFDPLPAVPAIYFDTDSSGDLNAGDVAYTPGTNDPALAADASVDVLIVNDIPLAVANGDVGRSELSATSLTGTGAAGDVFPGLGDGGVDAVIGTSGGVSADVGEYVVGDVQLAVQKTVSIADPFGGNQPVPGATLTYTVIVEVTNSGVATTSIVRDPVPTNTTYVASSITLNAASLTDAIDADEGELDTSGTPAVVVRLGDLTQADGVQTVTFQVTID